MLNLRDNWTFVEIVANTINLYIVKVHKILSFSKIIFHYIYSAINSYISTSKVVKYHK